MAIGQRRQPRQTWRNFFVIDTYLFRQRQIFEKNWASAIDFAKIIKIRTIFAIFEPFANLLFKQILASNTREKKAEKHNKDFFKISFRDLDLDFQNSRQKILILKSFKIGRLGFEVEGQIYTTFAEVQNKIAPNPAKLSKIVTNRPKASKNVWKVQNHWNIQKWPKISKRSTTESCSAEAAIKWMDKRTNKQVSVRWTNNCKKQTNERLNDRTWFAL